MDMSELQVEQEKEKMNLLAQDIVKVIFKHGLSLTLTIATLERALAAAMLNSMFDRHTTFDTCFRAVDRVPVNVRSHMLCMRKDFESMVNSLNN